MAVYRKTNAYSGVLTFPHIIHFTVHHKASVYCEEYWTKTEKFGCVTTVGSLCLSYVPPMRHASVTV